MTTSKELDLSFDDFAQTNGTIWWWATDLMKMLGYDDWDEFEKVIDKAIKACMNLLNVKHYDNFQAKKRTVGGDEVQDFKLSRFACMLTAMNGDSHIPQVAKAQYYFIETVKQFEIYLKEQDVERLSIRNELSDGFKSLNSTFTKQDGIDYVKFNSAGVQGMYNQFATQLAKRRNIDKNKLYETMGREELAANLFRVTQTEARIEKEGITGQRNLEQTHYEVGKKVRQFVKENTGKNPEHFPQERQLPEVKKALKLSQKQMESLDRE